MVTVNPWLLIFAFVYFFLTGVMSYVISKKIVVYFLDKYHGKGIVKIEPLVGSASFIFSYGMSLYLLYVFYFVC